MKKVLAALALATLASACSSSSTFESSAVNYADPKGDISDVFGPATNPKNVGANARNPLPGPDYQGQWYTTPDGCSYSRTGAPGWSTTWHLILNPHHIGQPNAHSGCPIKLGEARRL